MKIRYDVTGASGSRSWHADRAMPVGMPSAGALAEAAAALQANKDRLRYLVERGVPRHLTKTYGLGWDGSAGAYVFPVYENGALTTVVFHMPWREQRRYDVPAGSQAAIFPAVPQGQGVMLCAGMICSLVAKANGLPACTTTCGARLPAHLQGGFVGKRVAVVYDVGERERALVTLGQLQSAGAESAWAVDLPLGPGGDVADWFTKHGRSRRELLRLIREARP